MHEKSLFFLKPEGVPYYHEIKRAILKEGLVISRARTYVITQEVLRGLYSHVSAYVFERLVKQMLGHMTYVAVVEGNDAVKRLKKVCGKKTAPAECGKRSIRYRFGSHDPARPHINAIHRAGSAEEATQQIALFGFA